jgi:predicted amidohydrolase YtcJ
MKTLIYNAKIWSKSFGLKSQKFYHVIGFDDISGKILFLGYNENKSQVISEYDEVIDLKNKLILPSFIDGHCHLVAGAMVNSQINFRYASKPEDFMHEFIRFSKTSDDNWIVGGYFSDANFRSHFKVDKKFLDGICSSKPMFISRNDLHSCVLNSLAIKVLDIENMKKYFLQGEFYVDEFGNLTGEFFENAFTLIRKSVPQKTAKEKSDILKNEISRLHSFGITAVSDITFIEDLEVYKNLLEVDSLILDVDSRLPYEIFDEKEKYLNEFKNYEKKFSFKSFKAFYDGSLSSESALFKNNYQNKTNNGSRTDLVKSGEFFKLTKKILLDGYQPSVHAIGDKAVFELIEFISDLVNSNQISDINRFRIEHVQHLDKSDYDLFKIKNLILSVQPAHLQFDAKIAKEKLCNPESTHSYKPLIDKGIILCFGTDFPVVDISPFETIYYAMTRKVPDSGESFYPEYCFNLEDCLTAYTINNAYACFMENEKGSIEIGKFADFIVLENDLFTSSPDEIRNLKVEMTYFKGKRVY